MAPRTAPLPRRRLPFGGIAAATLGVWLTSGCSGSIGEMDLAADPAAPGASPPAAGAPARPGGGAPSPTAPGTPGVTSPPGGGGGPTAPPGTPSAATGPLADAPRLARLTRLQYDNTITALFGKAMNVGGALPPDAATGHYENDGEKLWVFEGLWSAYREAAERLAERAVSDADVYARITGCRPAMPCDANAYIQAFGMRALRRPLSEREARAFAALHARGASLVGSGDAFKDGVQVVVEALLEYPDFLYRTELSTKRGADGLIALDDFEKASRLSYALWNSMPDDELLAAARAGQLRTAEQLTAQVRRMVNTGESATRARMRSTVADFHRQWLALDQYAAIEKSATKFPAFKSDMAPVLRGEIERLAEAAMLDTGLGLTGLLTSTATHVDRNLAALYGLKGTFGSTPAAAELPAAERAGLLTRVGFLAANSHQDVTSPVFRGTFVLEHLLCAAPPPPPNGIDLTPPPLGADIRTRRQQVEKQTTSGDPCRACHEIINGFGYVLEGYDAIGRVQTTDNGQPIDARARLTIDGREHDIEGGLALSRTLAQSAQARACFASNWLEYLLGRPVKPGADQALVAQIAAGLGQPRYGLEQLAVDLVGSKSFTHRAPDAP